MKKLTIGNLNLIWKLLDNASGSLYNAFDNLSDLGFTDKSIISEKRRIAELYERIDISRIDILKQEIENIIDYLNQEKEIKAMEKELNIE